MSNTKFGTSGKVQMVEYVKNVGFVAYAGHGKPLVGLTLRVFDVRSKNKDKMEEKIEAMGSAKWEQIKAICAVDGDAITAEFAKYASQTPSAPTTAPSGFVTKQEAEEMVSAAADRTLDRLLSMTPAQIKQLKAAKLVAQ